MVVKIDLTEEMIDCFHFCAKKGNYQQLFNDYQRFFVVFVENLKYVHFPENKFCETVSKKFEVLQDFLQVWHSNRLSVLHGQYIDMKTDFPEFMRLFEESCLIRDWNNFYAKFRPLGDFMISEARNQGIIDLKIECKGKFFDNFHTRDEFLINFHKDVKNEPEPQAAPRRRTRIINDNSWLARASDNTTNGDVSQLAEQNTKILAETNDEQSSKMKNLAQTKTFHEAEASLKQDAIKKELNNNSNIGNAPSKNTNDESLKDQLLKEIAESKKNYEEKLEQLETKLEMNFGNQGEEINCRQEKMASNLKLIEQKITNRVSDLEERLLNFEKSEESRWEDFGTTIEESDEKSRIMKENNEMYLQQMEEKIQEKLEKQEEQMKIRENELKLKEGSFDKKMQEMMEMIKSLVKNPTTSGSGNSHTEITGPVRDNTIDTSQNGASENRKEPINSVVQAENIPAGSDSASHLDDEEIQRMEEDFQKKLAEQNRVYEVKLREAKKQRKEMNDKAEEEIKRLSGNLSRAASFRRSFHS